MPRRRIQQLRETGARRHGNDATAGRVADDYDDDDDDDDDDDIPTNNTALRMPVRRIRSSDDVTDLCGLHGSTAFEVGVICFNMNSSDPATKQAPKLFSRLSRSLHIRYLVLKQAPNETV